MTYGLIYQSEFDAIPTTAAVDRYYIKIYKKNYTGLAKNVTCAGDAVRQMWQTDDPKAPIKGSSLVVNLINPGNIPLSNFFSVEDDTFKVEYKWGQKMLFTGFLVQTNCSEPKIDTTHQISLSFTDNLGLLKGVPLNIAAELNGAYTDYFLPVERIGGGLAINGALSVAIGDIVIITNAGYPIDGTYHVLQVVNSTPLVFLTTAEQLTGPFSATVTANIRVQTPVDLSDKLPIKEYLRICLKSTNLLLNTDLYGNPNPIGGGVGAIFIDDAYLVGYSFSSGDAFTDCYDVLTKILSRFKCCLFQSYGKWNIVRWDELRYNGNNILSYRYNPDFTIIGNGVDINVFNYGNGSDLETDFTESIESPCKFIEETYNYVQNGFLLKNQDLNSLGKLLRSYVVASETWYEYEMTYWFDGAFAPIPERFIRVVRYTATGLEAYRVAVIKGSTGDAYTSAVATGIECNKGDVIKWSFQAKTTVSQLGPGFMRVTKVRLYDGINTYTLKKTGLWETAPTANAETIEIFSGDNSNTWHTFDIQSQQTPVSGIITVSLGQADITAGVPDETQYKNLNFSLIANINDTTAIRGQVHNQLQPQNINTSDATQISIDDSPRNSILGTLYLGTSTAAVRDRTLFWNRSGITESRRLGDIITDEELFWRSIPRSKYEGTLLNVIQTGTLRLGAGATFYPTGSTYTIVFPLMDLTQFEAGQTFTITGTSLNNGVYTVAGINIPYGGVDVVEAVVYEAASVAVLTMNTRVHLSMLNVIKVALSIVNNYVFGLLEIIYKEQQARVTMFEMYKDGETDSFLRHYDFKYLYDKT